jgi:hypothetical protein
MRRNRWEPIFLLSAEFCNTVPGASKHKNFFRFFQPYASSSRGSVFLLGAQDRISRKQTRRYFSGGYSICSPRLEEKETTNCNEDQLLSLSRASKLDCDSLILMINSGLVCVIVWEIMITRSFFICNNREADYLRLN